MRKNEHIQQFVRYFLIALLLILMTIIILRNAWLADDAFITFRTVDNFVNGFGLTWNVTERVQAYTNPLWMFLVSAVYAFSHEIFFTTIYLSVIVTISALLLFTLKIAQTWQAALVGIAVLCFSKAFVDYSTSGLENPLTFLLMALFFVIYFQGQYTLGNLFLLSLIASLCAVNRMDTLLFFVPCLIHAYAETRKWIWGIIIGCLGFFPFFLWTGFSLFYYGFPFPNTAYAKLNTGIADIDLALQGINYIQDSFTIDPISMMIIGVSIFSFCLTKKRRSIPISIGILLYIFYIVKVGGDFMSGRFLAAPVFCAVINICAAPPNVSRVMWAPALILSLFVGLQVPQSPVYSDKDYKNRVLHYGAIADERGWYYECTGYLIGLQRKNMPSCGWAWEGRNLNREKKGYRVIVEGHIGLTGFFAGPDIHFIDFHALSEPLLSRLNIINTKSWRIGHFKRNIPAGYVETVETGKNVIEDKHLAEYWDKLSYIIKGELFDPGRIKEIISINTGKYDHLLSRYRDALIRLDLTDMQTEEKEGIPWNQTGNVLFSNKGIHINLKKTFHTPQIQVSLRHNRHYRVVYFKGFLEAGMQELKPQKVVGDKLARYVIEVPRETARKGYTSFRIVPRNEKGPFSIGYVNMIEVDGNSEGKDTIVRE